MRGKGLPDVEVLDFPPSRRDDRSTPMTIHGGDEGEGDVRVWEEGTKAEGLSRQCNKTGAAAVKRENGL